MIDEWTLEVGCDQCSIATADGEDEARMSFWLVDVSAEPHRHVCPVCLATGELLDRQRSERMLVAL